MTLPFSPKKTRARKITAINLISEDEDASIVEMTPPRRSTRAKKSARTTLDDEAYEDDGEGSSEGRAVIRIKPAKKAVRKESRPAYGRIRAVADLDYDEDQETAILRAHRDFCEKCEGKPTHVQLRALQKNKGKKRRKSKRSEDEFEEDDNSEERVTALGGWVRWCVYVAIPISLMTYESLLSLKCPLVAHWSCLAKTQRDEILRAALERDKAEWRRIHGETESTQEGEPSDPPKPHPDEPGKRPGLDPNQTTEFICGQCMKGGVCMGCMQVALEPDVTHRRAAKKVPESTPGEPSKEADGDVEMKDATKDVTEDAPKNADLQPAELLFRCWTCKRLSHYAHLPLSPFADPNEDYGVVDRAFYYQQNTQWQCADCHSYVYQVENILAWRPFPSTAVEPSLPDGETPNYKSNLPREYLVKWVNRSYRRTQWVPHMWLVSTHGTKLKNFILGGSRIALLPEPVAETNGDTTSLDEILPAFAADEEMPEEGDTASSATFSSVNPVPDAERRIKPAWKTVDRALDVLLWSPNKRLNAIRSKKKHAKGKQRKGARVDSDSESVHAVEETMDRERDAAFDAGEQPSAELLETVEEWEKRNKRRLTEDDIPLVIWGLFKWHDMGYDDGKPRRFVIRAKLMRSLLVTWDSPPREQEAGYSAFQTAFRRLLESRDVTVKKLSKKEIELFDHDLPKDIFKKRFAFSNESQPKLGQNAQLSLMPFQVEGVNWLCNNWWNRQHCILADEMGLVSS